MVQLLKGRRGFSLPQKMPRPALRPTQFPVHWLPWVCIPACVKGPIHEVQCSPPSSAERLSDAIPLFLLYVSMPCTETSLLFYIYHSHGNQDRDLSSFQSLHASSEACPASYEMGTGVFNWK